MGLEPRREGVRSVTQIWLLELTAGEREGLGVTCCDDKALRNDRQTGEVLNEEHALILATALTQLGLKIVFYLLLLALFLLSTVHTAIR